MAMKKCTLYANASTAQPHVITAPTMESLMQAVATYARENDTANADGLMVATPEGLTVMTHTESDDTWDVEDSDIGGSHLDFSLAGAPFDEALDEFLTKVEHWPNHPLPTR